MDYEEARLMISQLCGSLYAAHGADAAEKLAIKKIVGDADMTEAAVRVSVHYLIRLEMREVRSAIQGASIQSDERGDGSFLPKQKAPTYQPEVQQRVSAWSGKYLQWPLSCRKLLGDALRGDIILEAEMYERNALGNARNGRFMRAILKRIPTTATTTKVGDILTDDQLAKIMAKSQSEK